MIKADFCVNFICPNIGKKGPKIWYFAFFESFVMFFQKTCQMKVLLGSWLSITGPMPDKFLCSGVIAQNVLGQSECRVF